MSTGYQTIIGGSAVYPSNQTYDAITLSQDTQLSWPIESVSSETIIADLLDVTPINQSGWNLILPDATGGSNGITMIVSNLSGSFDFNINDNTGNIVLNVTVGSVWLIYLTDNSTQAGVWRTFQYGAQAGSVNVAAIAGSGLMAIGNSLNQSMPVSAKGTNYTAVDGDRASVILWTGAAGTLTLPPASGVGTNWFINVANKGTGALTVSPPSGTIDGSASKIFTAGTGSAIVFTDGSNYYTVGYGVSGSTTGFDYTTINCAGSDLDTGPIVLSGGQLDRISYKCFGILTGNRSIVVPGNVQQYWIDNETTSSGGPWTLTIKTGPQIGGVTVSQPGQAITYCDGSNVQPATSGISLPIAISAGGTGATTAAAARSNLGTTAYSDVLVTAANQSAALAQLGGLATGIAVFQSATPSAALTAMANGTMTGTLAISSTLLVSGAGGITSTVLSLTSATQPGVGLVGLYKPAANQLGFSTNNVRAGYFDATQNLVLTHPLALAQGGTGASTLQTAMDALGDKAATINALAQRDGSGYLWATFFNMSGAVDDVSALDNVVYNRSADGFLRRCSLAHFASVIGPSLDGGHAAAAQGYQTFSSGITIQWGPTGDCAGSGTATTVGFNPVFPTNCWAVFIMETAAHLGGSAQAASKVTAIGRTQFNVVNNSNGTQAFLYFAIGN